MSKSNISRARKARVSKTTKRALDHIHNLRRAVAGLHAESRNPDPPVSATERDDAVRQLLSDGQLNAVRSGYFCDHERNLPIAGTERPLSCPFCGKREVSVVYETHDGGISAHVECDVCGVEGPRSTAETCDSYAHALGAARMWNERKGGAL